ncbi:patatin-like phospholipase family protein [Solilutibacter silvestris]|uniref:Patatin phospholipase n=1 Tax=Solilutibacter silvestris TaxID=1645665 RepID=A0A2K1Q3N1_9GAMM|nr:patatin-like phospholipase family protein [Lysobacter silvestris]PNS09648.1 Patatin phospholipase [Lysobacter silvestris]
MAVRKATTAKGTADNKDALHKRVARYPTVALVLQGGGALGAYQCGVYQALHEAGIEPNWIAGISIGAINAALIAGNPPEHRIDVLDGFWNEICQPAGNAALPALWVRSLLTMMPASPGLEAWTASLSAIAALWQGQQGFFTTRPLSPFALSDGSPAATSFYDTSALRGTLERRIDFDRINAKAGMRLTVGAVDVESGGFRYFDSTRDRIGPEHIMASAALPPAFPAVRIDGRDYWDGGLVSNTPLEHVLDEWPREDTLAFQVDLWNAHGPRPKTMMDVLERAKDIQYSSRTRHGTDAVARTQELRATLTKLINQLPDGKLPDELKDAMAPWLDDRVFNILHLIYKAAPCEEQFKDYAFGQTIMRAHWDAGVRDTALTLKNPDLFALPDRRKGFTLHDVRRGVE